MLKNAFYMALFALVSWGGYQLSYPSNTPPDLFYDGIFMEKIIQHIDKLTQGKRAVGDYYHDDVQRYLSRELSTMGWNVSKQVSSAFNPENRTAAPVRNIIAKKTGSQPDKPELLIMAHYDAAKFSGTGAGDDASGIAVILETLNAFIKTDKPHSNNIMVLFTDAEEVGLLGAHAFINEQLQNHNVGLIINLEARGSSGPVMMWPESTGGNRAMIEAYVAANVPMPVTTSLHYEVYKLLPNDTDLTPFSQLGQVNGFNLAFIDGHYNYHTQLDTLQNLSLNTLAHQTIQLHSMLNHFANTDLSQMHTEDSLVYFNLPMLGLISYPVEVNWLLLLVFTGLLIWQVLWHKAEQKTRPSDWLKSLLPLIAASTLAYASCWLLLALVYSLKPEFKDIMQGFPYQGHALMTALLLVAVITAMSVFGWFNQHKQHQQYPQSVLHIVLWLIVLVPSVYFMPGVGLLIWPVVFSIILLIINLHAPKLAEQMAPVLAVLTCILLGSLLIGLPIAMGIDILPITAILVTWLLALFLPVISPVKKVFHALLLLLLPVGYLAYALFQVPTISAQHPHPTSLSYLYDVDQQQGHYFNYDVIQSGWTEDLFASAVSPQQLNLFRQLYKKPLRHLAAADPVIALKPIAINASKPLKQGPHQSIDFTLTAHANTEVLEIYTKQAITLHKLSIEGRNAVLTEPLELAAGQRLLHYYFNGKKQIKLSMELATDDHIDWQLQSHSLDLLSQSEFKIPARPEHQIPKPFIKSDNTIVVQSFSFGLN